MSGDKTERRGGKIERPAPEKDGGKPDGAVDDSEMEGIAGGVHPVLNFPIREHHRPGPHEHEM